MEQKEREQVLRDLMALEKQIEKDIEDTRTHFDILCLAADMCGIKMGILKEELHVK